jgi:hypothetical protein
MWDALSDVRTGLSLTKLKRCPLLITSRHGLHRKHISSFVAFVSVAAGKCLLRNGSGIFFHLAVISQRRFYTLQALTAFNVPTSLVDMAPCILVYV